MIARLLRRLVLLRAARAAARAYGGGDPRPYEVELATTLRSVVVATLGGRVLLAGYRVAMRVLTWSAIAWVVLALVIAALIWQVEPRASVLAIVVAVPAALLAWWRLAWGAPLDWLEAHADRERTVAVAELPARLRELARQLREDGSGDFELADDLDSLADRAPDG